MYQLALDFKDAKHSSGAKLLLTNENQTEFQDFFENYLAPYLDQYFPVKNENEQVFHGLGFTILELIRLIASKNPEARIRAQVARDGGYDPCATAVSINGNETESSTSAPQVTYSCSPGFVKNIQSSYCYKVLCAERKC